MNSKGGFPTRGTEVSEMSETMITSCRACREALPDLLFEPGYVPGPEIAAHLEACPECAIELREMRATFALMDAWTAPEPTPYFDARVRAGVREAGESAPQNVWERLLIALHLGTGRSLRPALAGAFLFLLLLSGGTAATLLLHHTAAPTSPTVNDLRIFDNNAQAVQQMDMLDEPGTDPGTSAPQS